MWLRNSRALSSVARPRIAIPSNVTSAPSKCILAECTGSSRPEVLRPSRGRSRSDAHHPYRRGCCSRRRTRHRRMPRPRWIVTYRTKLEGCRNSPPNTRVRVGFRKVGLEFGICTACYRRGSENKCKPPPRRRGEAKVFLYARGKSNGHCFRSTTTFTWRNRVRATKESSP